MNKDVYVYDHNGDCRRLNDDGTTELVEKHEINPPSPEKLVEYRRGKPVVSKGCGGCHGKRK